MLERAKEAKYHAIARPNEHALMLLGKVMADVADPLICEIGVGVGATSVELCRKLNGRGEIHFYDFASKLAELETDLTALGFSNSRYFGNSNKTYDSYNWSIIRNYLEMLEADNRPYDFIFLDGAHVLHHDAPATAVLREMVAPGGIFLFDDYDWSLAVSPTQNPAVNPGILDHFTEDQIETSHVALDISGWLTLDGRVPHNLEIIRFEALAEEFARIGKKYGMKDVALPRLNASRHGAYQTYLTPDIERAIYRKLPYLFDQGFYRREILA